MNMTTRLYSSLITLSEKAAVVLGGGGRDAGELEVLFDVRAAAHADQRRSDAGRGARELDGRLRVGRERAEGLADALGEAARDLALLDGGAGDDRHAERLRRFEQRDPRAVVRVVLGDERLGHGEVEGELHEAEAVVCAADRARQLPHAFERVVAARALLRAKAVPRR